MCVINVCVQENIALYVAQMILLENGFCRAGVTMGCVGTCFWNFVVSAMLLLVVVVESLSLSVSMLFSLLFVVTLFVLGNATINAGSFLSSSWSATSSLSLCLCNFLCGGEDVGELTCVPITALL